jgi:hypothetical protein
MGTTGSNFTGTHLNRFSRPFSSSQLYFPLPRFPQTFIHAKRPRNDETTLSIPRRAKTAGFITLFVILYTFLLC